MGSKLNIVQTVQALNLASNGVGGIMHKPEKLQEYMEVYLNGGTAPDGTEFAGFFALMNDQLEGGDWRSVWGPSVFAVNDGIASRATNTMFVAHSPSLNFYVVAIAGTNFDSLSDWLKEDGNVWPAKMAMYPVAIPYREPDNDLPLNASTRYVSGASAEGISRLLTKLSDPATKKDVREYLESVANADRTLVFTGHSLGGALSPTLAMQLYGPSGTATGTWSDVLVQPSAGASPGNFAFAEAYTQAFPKKPTGLPTPFDSWNVNYANKRDVVPHAWNRLEQVYMPPGIPKLSDALKTFLTFWGYIRNQVKVPPTGFPAEATLDGLLIEANARAEHGGYTNLPLQEFEPDWGTRDKDGNWVDLPVYGEGNPMTDFDQVLALIPPTHIYQYSQFFGIRIPELPKK